MREQHNVPVPGRKKHSFSHWPPYIARCWLGLTLTHGLSLSDSLTGLLFLFISSVSVSAQWVVVGHVNLADQLVQNELRIPYKAWQTVIFMSLLFVPG